MTRIFGFLSSALESRAPKMAVSARQIRMAGRNVPDRTQTLLKMESMDSSFRVLTSVEQAKSGRSRSLRDDCFPVEGSWSLSLDRTEDFRPRGVYEQNNLLKLGPGVPLLKILKG